MLALVIFEKKFLAVLNVIEKLNAPFENKNHPTRLSTNWSTLRVHGIGNIWLQYFSL